MPRLRLTLEPPLYIWRASRVRGDSRFDHPRDRVLLVARLRKRGAEVSHRLRWLWNFIGQSKFNLYIDYKSNIGVNCCLTMFNYDQIPMCIGSILKKSCEKIIQICLFAAVLSGEKLRLVVLPGFSLLCWANAPETRLWRLLQWYCVPVMATRLRLPRFAQLWPAPSGCFLVETLDDEDILVVSPWFSNVLQFPPRFCG